MRTRWMVGLMSLWLAGALYTPAAHSFSTSALLDRLAHRYTSPHAVAKFLRMEFAFQPDSELFGEADRWQSPEEFLSRRAGDCEDYALLARELLARNWMTAYVFSLFGDAGYAHTVCVFVDTHGLYNVIDRDTVYHFRAPTLEALASRMYPGWTVGGIVERAGTQGRLVKQIIRSG